MIREMCEKFADTFSLHCVPNCCKTQEMCKKSVFKEPFMWKCCLDKYKSEETVDAADDSWSVCHKQVA